MIYSVVLLSGIRFFFPLLDCMYLAYLNPLKYALLSKLTQKPLPHPWIISGFPNLHRPPSFWLWWYFVSSLSRLFILTHSYFIKVTWHYYLKPSILCLTHYSFPGIELYRTALMIWINCFAFMSPKRGPGATQDGFEWKAELGFLNLWIVGQLRTWASQGWGHGWSLDSPVTLDFCSGLSLSSNFQHPFPHVGP